MVDIVGLFFPFLAGAATLLNPCGWALLPGYVSFLIGATAKPTRALAFGLLTSAGFIAIFGAIGLAVSVARTGLGERVLGYLVLASGVLVLLLAVSMLLQRPLLPLHFLPRLPTDVGYSSMLMFGLAYGLASLACSAPLFFSVIAYSLAVGGFVNAALTLTLYGLGMGGPLIVISGLVANGNEIMIGRLSRLVPRVQRTASLGLLAVGGYVLYFYYLNYLT